MSKASRPKIEMGPDFIRLVADGKELVRWHQREWKKNPALVYRIVEAVTVAAFEPELLEALLQKAHESTDR